VKQQAWERTNQEFSAKYERFAHLVQFYADLFERLTVIVEEDEWSSEWLRRLAEPNLLERCARGFEHGLWAESEREYLLGRVQQDIEELFNYAFNLCNNFVNRLVRRTIRKGAKQEHLAILLALTASEPKFQELKTLQDQLRDFVQNPPKAPLPPAIIGQEWELVEELSKLVKEEAANAQSDRW
jgi:hypothetical protein